MNVTSYHSRPETDFKLSALFGTLGGFYLLLLNLFGAGIWALYDVFEQKLEMASHYKIEIRG